MKEADLVGDRPAKRGKGSRSAILVAAPMKKCDEPGCPEGAHPSREVHKPTFVYSEATRTAAIAELQAVFEFLAATVRRDRHGRQGVEPIDKYIVDEKDQLLKAGIAAGRADEMIGRMLGEGRRGAPMRISRSRRKLGKPKREYGPREDTF
jgi:hypothetical protein